MNQTIPPRDPPEKDPFDIAPIRRTFESMLASIEEVGEAADTVHVHDAESLRDAFEKQDGLATLIEDIRLFMENLDGIRARITGKINKFTKERGTDGTERNPGNE